jgi:hypothetical protein
MREIYHYVCDTSQSIPENGQNGMRWIYIALQNLSLENRSYRPHQRDLKKVIYDHWLNMIFFKCLFMTAL